MYQGGDNLSQKICPDSPREAGQAVSPHLIGAGSTAKKERDKGSRRPTASTAEGFSDVSALSPDCRDEGPAEERQRRKGGEVPHGRTAARGVREECELVL